VLGLDPELCMHAYKWKKYTNMDILLYALPFCVCYYYDGNS